MAFALGKRRQSHSRGHEAKVIPLHGTPRSVPREVQMETAPVRGEASHGAGLSLTIAFLIAGGVIVAALTFWSGPDDDRDRISVEQPDSSVPIR